MSKPRVELVSTSRLPTYDPFKPSRGGPADVSQMSVAQRLVFENKRRAQQDELRRRTTLDVVRALAQTPVEIGMQIWAPDAATVWRVVEVVAHREDREKGMVLTAAGGEEFDLRELGDLYRVNPRTVDDMTSLYYIHEAGILANLAARARPEHLRPYTLMANVLIAVNPLVRTVEPKIQDYIKTQMGDRPPHPYAIAEVAFQQMALRTPAQCQSIVISGESGAGKTETSKIVLRYLTAREHLAAKVAATKTPVSAATELGTTTTTTTDLAVELDKRLWDTNPILEAFGNAKTLRNHNSSRFGKFMKLQFRPETNTLCGGFIETYLLEKFRVVAQIPGERNFHIFYFLLAGAGDALAQELRLGTQGPGAFTYLNQSGCIADPNVDDELLFDEVVSALGTVGIDAPLQKHLWTVLAGLLHLGNLALQDRETAEGDAGEIVPAAAASLEACATLLGVEPASLTRVITEREISTRGERFTIKRTAKEGGYVRDAIAKSIYQQLFKWILFKINTSLGHGASSLPFIGVLDIFGFESFETNDFEQLLINYANEALQATFNQQVFIAEQELFTQEGIEVGKIVWPDNRDCIELIASKPNGLLPLLDQEAKTPKPNDEKWNATLHKTHTGHAHFLPPHEKDKKYVFIIKHFATRVPYTIGNFIDKNNDTIPRDLEDFVMSSSSSLIKDMYTTPTDTESATMTTTNARKQWSVSAKFCEQMQDLVDTLNATRCNFIRCIKPNPTMTPGIFDHGYVVDQLRCTGMLATCELLKVGLPTRVSYEEICRIYKPVLPPTVTPMFAQYNERTFTEAVLWSFRVDPDAYRLGRTKVFFKTGKIALLDALLKVDMKKMGPWIVSRLRKWLARRRWRYAVAKILAQKAFLWLLEYTRKRKAAVVKLQAVMRMYQVRKTFIKQRNAYRNRMRRKALARKRWKAAIRAMIAGNALKDLLRRARARLAAQRATRESAATSIQAIVRGKLGRKRAVKRRQQVEEAKLRKRLQEEAAAVALEKKKTAKRRWRAAVYAVIGQRHFVQRLNHIRKSRLAVEEARRRAEEQQALLLQQQEAERQRLIEAERDAAERQRLLGLKRAAAAVTIQRAFRRVLARDEARRQAMLARAQQASLAAALAAQEAASAAELVSRAHQEEADALRRLNDLEARQKATGTLGTVGTVGALGMAGAASGAATLGAVEPLPAVAGQAGELGAVGSVGVAGALVGQETLQNADLSWMAQEGGRVEGTAVAGEAFNQEQLAQAGRDLFGEGNEMPQGPLLSADDDNLANPVRKIQEFPTGPPIPYKGGILTCTMLGHRKLQDENWGDEYTEYVVRVTWGRDILEQSKTSWLVGGRYNDFNALHQELKAAASGRRGKRAPWFPRFPKRHPFSSMIGKNQEEKFIIKREKELNRYMTQVLTQMPDALLNVHMDRFLNLSMRTTDISEREAYAEARKRWEEEEREALANAAEAQPLTDAELHEVEQLVHQLLQKVIQSAGDIRQDTELQEMIHAVKVLAPRVAASAQIGANVNMELVPLAMQLQDDIQDAFNQYHDTLLAIRLGQDIN